jgi:NAD+ diphosphatase
MPQPSGLEGAGMNFCPRCAAPLLPRSIEGRERLACSADSCDYVFYDNPVAVLAALVEHRETVLLVRNKGWPEKWYGLVTGFLEKGESPEEGVLREVREELGLPGEVISFIGAYPFVEMNQLILAYHVRAQGEIALGEELAGVKAIPPDQLRPWPLGTGHAVRDWLERRAQEPQIA